MRRLEPWEERFVVEYRELVDRAVKLKRMLDAWDDLDFEPKCPYDLLCAQYFAMMGCAHILANRADIEGIPLHDALGEMNNND